MQLKKADDEIPVRPAGVLIERKKKKQDVLEAAGVVRPSFSYHWSCLVLNTQQCLKTLIK